MDQVLATGAKHSSCAFHSGGHPAAAFAALTRKIEAHPLRVGTRTLGTGQYFSGVSNPRNTNDQAKHATMLAAAAKGNGKPQLASTAGSYNDAVSLAQSCARGYC